jgi:vanillin dehydrogenase
MKEYKLFINGENVVSSTNTMVDDINPWNNEVYAKVHMASKEDIDKAIDSAHKASKIWGNTPAKEREAILLKAASIIEQRAEEIRDILIYEGGATFGKATFEAYETADIFRVAAGEARRVSGQTHSSNTPNVLSYSVRRPLGVIAGISPFNFPMILAGKKIAMAIAAGNSFVLKPSTNTAVSGLIFGEILKEAGLPNGVFNAIPCSSSVLGETFQKDKRVKMITFTGSTAAGKKIAKSAAENLTKFTLELGGKSPIIILNDADVDYAVDTATFGIFLHQGQVCMVGSKVIVEEGIYEEFCEKFAAKVKGLRSGNPTDPTTVIGPVIEKEHCSFIDSLVKDALEKGAKALTGNKYEQNVYEATILADVDEDMNVFHDEVFGPVVSVIKAKDVDHAVSLANNTVYGLSSAVITNNIANALKLSEEIESGMVHVNGPTIQDEVNSPFGGVKESGMGREGGHFSIEEMTEVKWVTIEPLGNRAYPF